VSLGVGKRFALLTAYPHDLCGQSMGPTPKISVRVVPEASMPRLQFCSFRFAIFGSSARTLSAGSPKPIHDGGGSWCLAV
jgi:hypothetical protein